MQEKLLTNKQWRTIHGWNEPRDLQIEKWKREGDVTALVYKIRELEIELKKYRWIPKTERLPEYIESLKESRPILILDGKRAHVGYYGDGKFVYWSGSYCNTDMPNSQETITHWMPIILP